MSHEGGGLTESWGTWNLRARSTGSLCHQETCHSSGGGAVSSDDKVQAVTVAVGGEVKEMGSQALGGSSMCPLKPPVGWKGLGTVGLALNLRWRGDCPGR